jgi:hypothetical protein
MVTSVYAKWHRTYVNTALNIEVLECFTSKYCDPIQNAGLFKETVQAYLHYLKECENLPSKVRKLPIRLTVTDENQFNRLNRRISGALFRLQSVLESKAPIYLKRKGHPISWKTAILGVVKYWIPAPFRPTPYLNELTEQSRNLQSS